MEQSPNQKAIAAYAIAGSMIMSSVIITAVGTFVFTTVPAPYISATAVQILGGFGAVALIVGNLIFRNHRRQLEEEGQALTDPKYIPYLVVSYAVQEIAVLIGLALTITTGDKSWVQLFGVFTVLGMISSLPKLPGGGINGTPKT